MVKLPAERVEELIAASVGEPFRAGKKSPMRQWVVVTDAAPGVWEALAEEAYRFGAGGAGRPAADGWVELSED